MRHKKRLCTLCEDGKVFTDAPKDKAVCRECAIEMMDGECNHNLSCDCPCHLPGNIILHSMACCDRVGCGICGKEMDWEALSWHVKTCHKTLLEYQGIKH